MREEILLEQKFGRKAPFTVPENYFSDFEKRLLADIPVLSYPTHVPMFHRLRPILCAACVAAAVVCGIIYMAIKPSSNVQYAKSSIQTIVSEHEDNTDALFDAVSDFAMLDNGDFYSYVSGE